MKSLPATTPAPPLGDSREVPGRPEEIAEKAPKPEPEPELTSGELFDGNIGKLGRVVHDLPYGNGG